MTPKQESFIKKYNQNPDLIEKVYNKDRGEMLQYIIQQELLDYVDEELFEDYTDLVLYEKLNSKEGDDKMNFLKEITDKYISDVSFEGDKIYLDTDADFLSDLFKEYRNESPRYVAKEILSSGDGWWEPYQNVIDRYSFYDNCIETLTPENLKLVAEKMNEEYSGEEVEPTTELLEEIAEEQDSETVTLNTDLILNRILNDKDTAIKLLWKNSDVGNELTWRYDDAYNQAAVDMYHDYVFDGIENFFNSDKKPEAIYTTKKYYDGKTKTELSYKVDITRSYYDIILKHLSNWSHSVRWGQNIDYYGSLSSLISEMIRDGDLEEISFRADDYPDYRVVEELYNQMLPDYI